MDDPNEEYLVWQTLVGAWPIVPSRLEQYLEKALREAKRNTNWIDPDERHEARVRAFVRSLYENQAFLDDFEPFVQRVDARRRARVARRPAAPAHVAGAARTSTRATRSGRSTSSTPTTGGPSTGPALPGARRDGSDARDDEVPPDPPRPRACGPRIRRRSSARTSRSTSVPDRVGFVRGGRIRVVVPLRPRRRASESETDLLPEFPQEVSCQR